MFSLRSLRFQVLVAGSLAGLGVVLVAGYLLGSDVAGLAVAVLPTALGVISAVQAIRSESPQYRRRWSIIFAVSGVVISAAIIWQQHSSERRARAERKELQDQIAGLRLDVSRSLIKIEDVSVSFRVRVPLDHPALLSFRQRVEKCAQEIIIANALKCGAAPHTVSIATGATIRDFFLNPGTELYPNQQTETVAYTLLNNASVDIGLFKDAPPSAQQLFSFSAKPDLRFLITETLDRPENRNPANGTAYVGLFYDIDSKSLFVEGNRVPVNNATWRTNGKVASPLDLQNAFAMFSPSLYLISVTLTRGPTPEWITAMEISRTISLKTVTLHMSKGYDFEFSNDRLDKAMKAKGENGSPVYVVKVIE